MFCDAVRYIMTFTFSKLYVLELLRCVQLQFVTLRHVTFTLCCFTLCSNIVSVVPAVVVVFALVGVPSVADAPVVNIPSV